MRPLRRRPADGALPHVELRARRRQGDPERDELSGADLVERARALAPLLAEQAAEAERLRRPTDAAIDALREAGVFELMVPRCYGGLELDLDTFLEVGLALGEGDASLAWVATFYIEHCWMFCQFPEAFQRVLFADRSHVLAPAAIAPNGRAARVEGGYRLSGRWQWGTGIAHADWVILGALVDGEGEVGSLDVRLFALPREEVAVDDTWFVDGMCGTGSSDLVVDAATVPEERSVRFLDMADGCAHGARLHPGPLYRTPMFPILALAASLPAVGQAKAALRDFGRRLGEREVYGTGKTHADRSPAQIRLARADLETRQAEQLLRGVVADMRSLREAATVADRARWLAMTALAVDQSRRVVRAIADGSGASAHFLSQPLQRRVRDLDTMAGHVVFDLDSRLEIHGRSLLGKPPGGPV